MTDLSESMDLTDTESTSLMNAESMSLMDTESMGLTDTESEFSSLIVCNMSDDKFINVSFDTLS